LRLGYHAGAALEAQGFFKSPMSGAFRRNLSGTADELQSPVSIIGTGGFFIFEF